MAMLPSFKVQDIVDLIKKGATMEAQEKIMELREGAMRLQEENLEFKKQLEDLQQEVNIKKSLDWDGAVYWIKNEESNEREGPYCQPCWDKDKNLVRLQHDENEGGVGVVQWYCAVCQQFFSQN